VALLAGLSLVSHFPRDPSLFHRATEPEGIRNWIGPFGAQLSAIVFATIGVSGLALPVLLALAAWRRLRRQSAVRVVGRGLGAIVLIAALPGLLQLTVERIAWRGVPIAAGGGFGKLLVRHLTEHLGGAGALLLLAGGVIVGTALVVQSTLGEVLAIWRGVVLGRESVVDSTPRARAQGRAASTSHREAARSGRGEAA